VARKLLEQTSEIKNQRVEEYESLETNVSGNYAARLSAGTSLGKIPIEDRYVSGRATQVLPGGGGEDARRALGAPTGLTDLF